MAKPKPESLDADARLVLFGGRIPGELHLRAKRFAVDNRLQIREVLEKALVRFLDEQDEARGGGAAPRAPRKR